MRKLLTIVLAFAPALLFAGELKVSAVDKELEIPLEGVKISIKGNSSLSAQTDETGLAVISVPDNLSSGTIEAKLAGYQSASAKFSASDKEVQISMSIESVIEGQTLVVNRASPDGTEEKTGVSTVMTKEEMHTTANVGLMEDCMSAVRTLPGVSYSGAWGTEPSVRGAEPREFSCLLDGMYTLFPWHWGGGVSIFNPAMVESVKLSNGVFSAKYGRASSGILEATTIKPDYENFHLNLGLATASADAFAQIPFGKKVGGMIMGAHLTYLEPFFALFKATGSDALDMIKRPPYIRDFFVKANFTPKPELDISLTGFFGSDGLEIDQTETKHLLKTNVKMDYDIYQALAGINIKYLASDKLLFRGSLSYNGMFEDMKMKSSENGFVRYNDDFVYKYASMYPSVTRGGYYYLNNLQNEYREKIDNHLFAGRFDTEIQVNDQNRISFGIDEFMSNSQVGEYQNYYADIGDGDSRLFKKLKWQSDIDGNNLLSNSAYVSWNYGKEKDFLQAEVGLRFEYMNMFNIRDNYCLNLIPDLCPRASVSITPFKDIGLLDRATFTIGSGLFTSVPRDIVLVTKEMGIKDFDLHSNRAIFAVLGANAALTNGWNFKLETYYKYYLSRIYGYSIASEQSGYTDSTMIYKDNGKGHVFGIDTMIEKKAGGKWDGYLSYSFVYSRLKNPTTVGKNDHVETMSNAPLDEWFYPSYHRFHTLNIVSNWHFAKGWTFTVKGTLATGAPKQKIGDVSCYAARMDDGTIVQRYSRSSFYSDTLRTQISCPVDLRISYQWTTHNDKAKWEVYFALQDVFVNLYSPKGDKSFNSYTGEPSDNSDSVDFNIGLPIPSIGVKVQF
ncbi:MAG: TonB-dependent receptor plug domain-containing protein [Treponema sp.]|nr:TonB-dependent receptor plug domain-containing protein [Treponema sp.]